MPADYVIDSERRIVYSTLSGSSNAQELLAHQRQLQADPAFAPDFNQLIDARDLKSHSATTSDLQHLAQQNLFGAGSRRAIVVSKDVHYGMARMFEMMRQGKEQIMVFRDLTQARQWLGLEKTDS